MKKKTLSDFRGAVPSKEKLDFEEERSRAKKQSRTGSGMKTVPRPQRIRPES